jgi:hypothetical protein
MPYLLDMEDAVVSFHSIRFTLLLSCALLFAPIVRADDDVSAWEAPGDSTGLDHEATTPEGAQRVRDRLADKFNVSESKITELRDKQLGYGEIDHTLTLASRLPGGVTDENVAHVLDLRQQQHMGWGEIAHSMDTTLGEAKHSPAPTPTPTDGAAVQPTSVSRPGKSAASASSGASGHGQAHGPGAFSGGGSGPGGGAGGTVAAHGHGGGMGAASSHGSHGNANGRAGGHK